MLEKPLKKRETSLPLCKQNTDYNDDGNQDGSEDFTFKNRVTNAFSNMMSLYSEK